MPTRAAATGVPADAGEASAAAGSNRLDDRQHDSRATTARRVVFTPDDVHARPPDHPPTESAPESEKAGLIFERS